MKKTIFFLLAMLTFAVSCNSQIKQKHKQKIRAYKIAFLTEKLALTEKEAEKFWPIYNAYDKKMMALRKEERYEIRKKIKKTGGLSKLTEEQAKEVIQKIKKNSEERHTVKTNFYNKISSVLSYKKLLLLEFSEHEFDRKLLRKLRHEKHKNK